MAKVKTMNVVPVTVVQVKTKLADGAKLPDYGAYGEDIGCNTGCDLFANEDVVIRPMDLALIGTGLFVEVPQGIDMQIRSKSGIALKKKVIVLNQPGTIDASYRNEVKVMLFNLGEEPYHVKKGDKIAQAVFAPIVFADFVTADSLTDTQRGLNGFGGSGI